MTTLVMVQVEDDVIVGWDSLMTRTNEAVVLTTPKFVENRGVIYGVAGTSRASDLFETHKFPEYDGSDPRLWLIKKWVPAARNLLMTEGGALWDHENGRTDGFGLMVVVGGQGFEFDQLLNPGHSVEGIYTMGSGGEYARGVIYAEIDRRANAVDDVGPIGEAEVLSALRAAAMIDHHTGGPLHVARASVILGEER